MTLKRLFVLSLLSAQAFNLAGCTVYRTDGPDQKKSDKVYLCHQGQTLRLSDNAIRAHLNHGDQLGICSADNNQPSDG